VKEEIQGRKSRTAGVAASSAQWMLPIFPYPRILTNIYIIYIYKTGGSIYVDQVMSLSYACGGGETEYACNDKGCACASGGCTGDKAPSITEFLYASELVYINIGK
jgi:hypothetical protein